VIPRYGEYAEARDLGVRRRYRVAGQVWRKMEAKTCGVLYEIKIIIELNFSFL
jgi:hypothetical protein